MILGRFSYLIALTLLLLTLAACGTHQTKPTATPLTDSQISAALAGRLWVAESIHGLPVVDMSHTVMVFTEEGKVSGSGGCNAYVGNSTVKDGMITFSPLGTTLKMCAPALNDQERRFFDSLATPQQVTFVNGLLHFTPAHGEPSVFAVQK